MKYKQIVRLRFTSFIPNLISHRKKQKGSTFEYDLPLLIMWKSHASKTLFITQKVMGTKTSKRINNEDLINTRQDSSSKTVRRSYAKWDCQSPLMSNDIDRLTNEEMNHLRKHQQKTKNSSNSRAKHQISPSKNLLTIEQLVEHRSNKEIDFDQLNSLENFQIVLIDPSDLQVTFSSSNSHIFSFFFCRIERS